MTVEFARGLVFFTSFVLAGCGTIPVGQDIAASWDRSVVYLPGSSSATDPGAIAVTKPLPVVIYLHGCSGITTHNDIPWAKFIKELGYIVVQPDSLARRDRGASCDPGAARHFSATVHQLRIDEAEFALKKLQTAKWADAKNIFLMGHSEGAVAAARGRIDGLRGVIISSWTCTSPYATYDGIYVPKNIPILTMGWDMDPWFYGTASNGSCANKFGDRSNARHIGFSGRQHSTVQEQAARDAVAQFLKANLQ